MHRLAEVIAVHLPQHLRLRRAERLEQRSDVEFRVVVDRARPGQVRQIDAAGGGPAPRSRAVIDEHAGDTAARVGVLQESVQLRGGSLGGLLPDQQRLAGVVRQVEVERLQNVVLGDAVQRDASARQPFRQPRDLGGRRDRSACRDAHPLVQIDLGLLDERDGCLDRRHVHAHAAIVDRLAHVVDGHLGVGERDHPLGGFLLGENVGVAIVVEVGERSGIVGKRMPNRRAVGGELLRDGMDLDERVAALVLLDLQVERLAQLR